jgi:glycosyltransferase involved in cell wall biosynthesis
MRQPPLVSVIVPNFNHASFLEERMKSILEQSFADYEIIILDDHSTDHSREIIEKYRDLPEIASIVYNEENSGSSFVQWEKGISMSRGKYIWIAESDDSCERNFLEEGIRQLENGYDLFYALTVNVDEQGAVLAKTGSWYEDLSLTRWKNDFENNAPAEAAGMLAVKNTIPNASAVLFRRTGKLEAYLEKIKHMRYCGDWIFWLLYLRDAGKMYYSVKTKDYFRSHPAVTRRTYKIKKRNAEVLEVLKLALRITPGEKRKKFLVRYYFVNHLFRKSKRDLLSNTTDMLKQVAVSFFFFSCWISWYRNKPVLTGENK